MDAATVEFQVHHRCMPTSVSTNIIKKIETLLSSSSELNIEHCTWMETCIQRVGRQPECEWGLYVYVIIHTILPPSLVILWELGGKPKWLPLNFGYQDAMRTALIEKHRAFSVQMSSGAPCITT